MVSNRLIQSGKAQRKEYCFFNRSDLFKQLPQGKFSQEQKNSYDHFLQKLLPSLLQSYFPVQVQDYNNKIELKILEYKDSVNKYVRIEEPKFSVEEVYQKKTTWSKELFLKLAINWKCEKINYETSDWYECLKCEKNPVRIEEEIKKEWKLWKEKKQKTKCEHYEIIKDRISGLHLVEDQEKKLKFNLKHWVENSFKIGKFDLNLINEKENQWEAREANNGLEIILWVFPSEIPSRLSIKFNYKQEKEFPFCLLPKMTERGNFIINGNNRVVVFQSVRAPGVYFYQENKTEMPYSEIIPFKGSWIRIYLDNLTSSTSKEKKLGIKLKFLNIKKSFNLTQFLVETPLSAQKLLDLLNEEVIKNSLESEKNSTKAATTIPKFLFNEKNTYFLLGKLGRIRFNQKFDILKQISGQTLAQDLKDKQGKLILPAGTALKEDKVAVIQKLIEKNNLPQLAFENYQFYSFQVLSPNFPSKKVNILGPTEESQKIWFDWGDLIIVLSSLLNLSHGIGKIEKEEEEKDSLENQVIRRVGDLLYDIFYNKFGIFKQSLESKYLGDVSQLKKTNPFKLLKIQEFNKALISFFHSSTLVQLQNETNPLAEISHARKISALGTGGFNSSNVVLSARNINHSYYGRYCPVETPEGQKVGLIHSLAINAAINEYGQVLASYYLVKQGKIIPEIVYLTPEEELDKYITHCSIKINENNSIEEEMVWARHQRKFVLIPKEKINYIDNSFYNLNSINSSNIPFFQHNDSTRMLMAANMQKQAVMLLKSEAPLITSGTEHYLLDNALLTVKANSTGTVNYVDSEKIIIDQKEYFIKQFQVSSTNSLFNSVPVVEKGEIVQTGQIISCGSYQEQQELALGQNLRVAFMCWKGYNFEDAIVVNERLVKEDILTSLFAKKYVITRKKVKIDKKVKEEEFYPRKEIGHLDDKGIVKLGSEVSEKNILVSKRTPCKQREEELFLTSISGEEIYSFKDNSLYLPQGERPSIVYKIESWKTAEYYKNQLNQLKVQLQEQKDNQAEKVKKLQKKIKELTKEVEKNQIRSNAYGVDELEIVEIYVVQKRSIETGDKLTTRFGNKGVVGKIIPEVDMPFDQEGKTIDIILNPLSVPSRMNIGQLVESFLGLIAHKLKTKLLFRPFNNFDWEKITQIAQENNLQETSLIQLYDGQTGLPFEKKISVGYIYFTKLNHMVADKIHARNTGPYARIHQQPLKGKSHGGGQKAGEMELWAFEAHGAAYNLLEMTGAKSDDLYWRKLIQNYLIFGKRELTIESTQSESFNLLLQYLRGIGFNLTAFDYQDKNIDFYKKFSKFLA